MCGRGRGALWRLPDDSLTGKPAQNLASTFRSMAPYIAAHRDSTIVIHIPGECLESSTFQVRAFALAWRLWLRARGGFRAASAR